MKGKIDDLREGGRYDAALRLVVVALGPHEALAEDVRDWWAERGRLDCVRSDDAIADGGGKSKSVLGSSTMRGSGRPRSTVVTGRGNVPELDFHVPAECMCGAGSILSRSMPTPDRRRHTSKN